MSRPGHEIQSFFTSYLVPHFSEVWKCGIVWQSKDSVAQFPQSSTPCHSLLSSTLLRGVEVWKNDKGFMTGGNVRNERQYPYFVRLFHISTPLRSVVLSKKWRNSGFHGQVLTCSFTRMYVFPNRLCKKRLEASLDLVAHANMHTSTNCAECS